MNSILRKYTIITLGLFNFGLSLVLRLIRNMVYFGMQSNKMK